MLAALFVIAVSVGIVVQVSANLPQGYMAASVNILGVQAVRIKLFECGGNLYYQLNGGALRKIGAGSKKGASKGKRSKRSRRKIGRLYLRSIAVNASVGSKDAAVTAMMSAALGQAAARALNRYVRARECKSAVNAEYGRECMALNARAEAGWRTLFTIRKFIRQGE